MSLLLFVVCGETHQRWDVEVDMNADVEELMDAVREATGTSGFTLWHEEGELADNEAPLSKLHLCEGDEIIMKADSDLQAMIALNRAGAELDLNFSEVHAVIRHHGDYSIIKAMVYLGKFESTEIKRLAEHANHYGRFDVAASLMDDFFEEDADGFFLMLCKGKQNIPALKYMLTRGKPVSEAELRDCTEHAISNDDLCLLDTLLAHGARFDEEAFILKPHSFEMVHLVVDHTTRTKAYPLEPLLHKICALFRGTQWYCTKEQALLIILLIDHGAMCDKTVNGNSALQTYLTSCAHSCYTEEVLRRMLAAGTDLNEQCMSRCLLSYDRDTNVAKLVLSLGMDVTAGMSPLYSPRNEPELLKQLIDAGADPTVWGSLFWAHSNDQLSTKILFDAGRRLEHEENNDNILNCMDTAQLFIDMGADVNKIHGMPLHTAIEQSDVPLIRLLVKHGAHENGDGLYKYCYNPRVAAVLFELGFEPEESFLRGQWSLHTLIIMRKLMSLGLKYDREPKLYQSHDKLLCYEIGLLDDVAETTDSNTLQHCYSRGDWAGVEKLKNIIDTRGMDGETILHHACEEGDLEKVRRVVDLGANTALTLAGCTPLSHSILNDHVEVSRFLFTTDCCALIPRTLFRFCSNMRGNGNRDDKLLITCVERLLNLINDPTMHQVRKRLKGMNWDETIAQLMHITLPDNLMDSLLGVIGANERYVGFAVQMKNTKEVVRLVRFGARVHKLPNMLRTCSSVRMFEALVEGGLQKDDKVFNNLLQGMSQGSFVQLPVDTLGCAVNHFAYDITLERLAMVVPNAKALMILLPHVAESVTDPSASILTKLCMNYDRYCEAHERNAKRCDVDCFTSALSTLAERFGVPNENSLHVLCKNENICSQGVRVLMECGCAPSIQVLHALVENASAQQYRAKKKLMKQFCELLPGEWREEVLHHAGTARDVCDLVELGAFVNAKLKCGFTPLHSALKKDRPDVVFALIQHGADVNAAGGPSMTTPLHVASIVLTSALLNAGAVPTRDVLGKYPAHVVGNDAFWEKRRRVFFLKRLASVFAGCLALAAVSLPGEVLALPPPVVEEWDALFDD
eukprot:TRINITY_DN3938_c0_g3_i1.p1 TRINITY_DN3938_c0_g3~~TRINITY_DN3938_c0_g3_i1.p1  ORF type:complete len:1094 (+),score=214.63 TRINITY_DN3938_c0_g3_i1:42-3284(+)